MNRTGETLKNTLMTLLKLVIGLGLVVYVLRSKMIDFKALESMVFSPSNVALGLAFFTLSSVLCTIRWYLLAKTQGLNLNGSVMFQLTMIGNFFNTFMPGSVGGDLIKAWYVAGREPQRKTKAILSVIVDRALGLSIFIFYAAVTLLFYFPTKEARPELRVLAWTVWLLTLSGAFFVWFFLFSSARNWSVVTKFRQKLEQFDAAQKLIEASRMYRDQHPSVLLAAVMSAISFTAMIFFYKIEGDALGISMSLGQYFFVVPLAMVVSAVPLLPGGIGVGQVAFFTLFQWVGNPMPAQGATLCTLVQIYTILFNCLGAFFYIRFRRKPQPLDRSESLSVQFRRTSARMI